MYCTSAFNSWILSLVNVCIGSLIGFFSAKYMSDRTIRANARAKFRAAFAPAIARLSLGSDNDAIEIRAFFKTEALVHASAIEEFRPFVCKRAAYEKAFKNYYDKINDFTVQDASKDNESSLWSTKIVLKYGATPIGAPPKNSILIFYAELTEVLKEMIQIAS